ncbi:MAG: DUF2339 domain-containing protein [Alphaproteobacteria bacterium]|nr:DUF2339 domain-containing protein [Alphaproteobacteria bacterium]
MAWLVGFAGAFVLLVGIVMVLGVAGDVRRLSRRVRELEDQVDRLQRAARTSTARPSPVAERSAPADPPVRTPAPEARPAPAVPSEPLAPAPTPTAAATASPTSPDAAPASVSAPRPAPTFLPSASTAAPPRLDAERLAVWLGAAVGGLAVVVGLLLALAVAIEHGLVPPVVRVLGSLVGGVAVWRGGARLRQWSPVAGASLVGVGVAMLYGGVYAASELYALWPQALTLLGVAIVSAAALRFGLRHDARLAAALGVVGGVGAPLLLSHGADHVALDLLWLLVLQAASGEVAARKRWAEGIAIPALAVALTATIWLLDTGSWVVPWVDALVLGAAGVAGVLGLRVHADDPAGRAAVAVVALALPVWVGPGWLIVDEAGVGDVAVLVAALAWAWSVTAWRDEAVVRVGVLPVQLLLGMAAVASPAADTAPLLAEATVGVLVLATVLARRAPDLTLLVDGQVVLTAGGLFVLSVGDHPVGHVVVATVATLAVAVAPHDRGRGMRVALAAATLPWVLLPIATAHAVATLGVGGALVMGATWAAVGLRPLQGQDTWATARWAVVLAPVAFGMPAWEAWLAWRGGAVDGGVMDATVPTLLGMHTLAAVAVLLRRGDEPDDGARIGGMLLTGLAFVTLGLVVGLDDLTLYVALAIEAAVVAALARVVASTVVPFAALGLGLLATALLCKPSTFELGDTSGLILVNWTLLGWGLPAASLLGAAWAVAGGRVGGDVRRVAVTGLGGLGVLLGFVLVNVEVSQAFGDGGPIRWFDDSLLAGMTRSVAWGVYGSAWLVAGMASDRSSLRFTGFGLLLLGTLKVFAVDLFSLSGIARVGSLLGVGVCLVGAAWLFEKVVRRPARSTGASEVTDDGDRLPTGGGGST